MCMPGDNIGDEPVGDPSAAMEQGLRFRAIREGGRTVGSV